MLRMIHFVIDCPFPPVSGGDIRNAMFADSPDLSEYLCVGLSPPASSQAPSTAMYHHLQSFGSDNPWHCFDPQDPTCLEFPKAALAEIERLIDSFRPDVLVMAGVAWGALLRHLRHREIPIILDCADVESQIQADVLKTRRWYKKIFRGAAIKRAIASAQDADKNLSLLADQTWVCSTRDRCLLQSLGGVSHQVIVNPIPDESLLAAEISEQRYCNPAPFFVGHLSYFPNVAAVLELATEFSTSMLPHNINAVPIVAGRSPNRQILRQASRGRIQLIVNPPSCARFLTQSGFTLLPIRHGSGTRIKALEALAAGVVVIATGKAVEGLALEHGLHYLRADTMKEMCELMCGLISEPHRACDLARRGREFVAENHSRAVIQESISTELRQLKYPSSDCSTHA